MATPSGKPGRDYYFNITVKDVNGDPQDLTALQGYALVVHTTGNRTIAQYSKAVITGYLTIEETDAIAGEIKIKLPAANTQGIDNTLLMIEFVGQVNGDKFGTKDGISFELINITSTPKPKVPTLS